MEWQPIETAPKDFSAFQACDQYGQQWICSRGPDGVVIAMAEATHHLFRGQNATHWHPLLPPPLSPSREQ